MHWGFGEEKEKEEDFGKRCQSRANLSLEKKKEEDWQEMLAQGESFIPK